jgi:prenyltransferase beta subunit
MIAVMLLCQLAGVLVPAYGASASASPASNTVTIDDAIEDAASYLLAQNAISDWDAYALGKAGKTVPASYIQDVTLQLQRAGGQYSLVTDYARIALGVTGAGQDARNIGGYNLIEKIYNNDRMEQQGNNGVIYSLWALDSGRYSVPDHAKWTKHKLVQYLLNQQNKADGGWCCAFGGGSSIDLTAAALTALVPYKAEPQVQDAVAAAVKWLSSMQLSNGGYSEPGAGENAETAAQVIIALSGHGINPASESFTKQNGNLLQALMRYRNNDGGFAHLLGTSSSAGTTNQALLALAAFKGLNVDGGTYSGSRRSPGGGEAQKAFVGIRVEGPQGVIAEGSVQAATAYEALDVLLSSAHIHMDAEDRQWGKYVTSINGIRATDSTFWLYNVKRNGAWDYAQTSNIGISGYTLKNGDEVVVYYASSDTQLVGSVKLNPDVPQANQAFTVEVKKIKWDGTASVAENVYVQIGGQSVKTDANGTAFFAGLPEGSYDLTVTGDKYQGAPLVVREVKQIRIGTETSAYFKVEGPSGPITSGGATVTKALDALEALLNEKHISYQIVNDPSFGKYVKSIGGYADYWNFAVWRKGEWKFPDVGMADYPLETDDQVVVYYGGFNPPTRLIQSISVYPPIPQAYQPFGVMVEKADYDWMTNTVKAVPASGVQVQIGNLIATTNEQGIAVFSAGMSAGAYTLTVSGYVPDSPPKVVRTTKLIAVGATSHVSVAVEGSQGPVANGIANLTSGTTALDALRDVLAADHIPNVIVNGSYVQNIKDDSNGWNYAVWRKGKWEYPQIGMDAYRLQDGDHVLVYFGGFDSYWNPTTFVVDSIAVNPEQPLNGQAFTVTVKKGYWDYLQDNPVISPAEGVKVTIGSNQALTDSEGTATFSGLASGTYAISVTGYVYGQAPKVVRAAQLLTVQPPFVGGGGGGGGTSNQPYVTVSVTGDEARGEILPAQRVSFESGDTPYSVLVKALGQDRVETKGTGDSLYVSGIDGLREFDKGPESGWMYAVNCTFPVTSAGGYKLKSKDKVDWRYTKDNGKDVKASGTVVCTQQSDGTANTARSSMIPAYIQDGINQLGISFNNQQPASLRVQTVVLLNADRKMDAAEAKRLKEELAANIVKVEKSVSADQNAVLADDKEEVKLQIPAQAMTESKTIGIQELASQDRKEAISSLYELTPSGMKFNAPVYVSIKAPLAVDKLEHLALAWLKEDTNQWIPIPAVIDASTGVVTGAVDHFTKFAVIDKSKLEFTATLSEVSQAIDAAVSKVLSHSDLSDWEAVALAAAGKKIPDHYLPSVEKLLKERNGQLRNVTDYERMALGVQAAGGDPQNIAGVDLIEKIYNNDRMTSQGANGPIFALMVLQKGNYSIPATAKWNRESLLAWLLQQQNADGSWSLVHGEEPNVDLTGMALVALAPFMDRPEVKQAADKALLWLSKEQTASGGFKLAGQENSESISWVLLAQASLGIGPADPRFAKANGNTLTSLLSYQQADGGFAHIKGEASGQIPTEQALLALAMYRNVMKDPAPVSASSGEYADAADISGWALGFVNKAKQYGLMEGVDGNRFAPKEQLTRAQFVAIVLRLLGEAPSAEAKQSFTDVRPGEWYYGYVAKAAEIGIVNGMTSDSFEPNSSMSRQDMALVLSRAFNLEATAGTGAFNDIKEAYDQAVPAIQAVHEHGLMEGDEQGNFRPAAAVTREMAAAVMVRAYEKKMKP